MAQRIVCFLARPLALLAAATLVPAAAAEASTLNFAAAFRWRGYVSTSLPFSSFYGDDHSVVFKFMAQFPGAYQGPMFAGSSNGNYLVAMGDFGKDPNGVKLQVTFGGNTAYFSGQNVPQSLVAGKWNSLAVVKQNGRYRVYLNSQLLSRDDCSVNCTELAEGSAPVSGRVRFGRVATGDKQFYGFLDDVLVFDRAITPAQVWLYSVASRLSGNENGVLRAWTFDSATPDGDPHPPTVEAGTFVAPASKAFVSQARDSAFDAKLLPPPTVTVELPFAKGVAWKVTQEFAAIDGSSHFGSSAFAYDFARHGVANDVTCGSTLTAAASGTLFHAYDEGGDLDPNDDLTNPIDGYNDARIELDTPGEYLRYLHIQTGSVRDTLGLDELPPAIAPVAVTQNQRLAKAGTRGPNNCHLHFGYRGASTIPLGFNYERYDPTLPGWVEIQNGMPRYGEIIRRP